MNVQDRFIKIAAAITESHVQKNPDEFPRKVFHFDSPTSHEQLDKLCVMHNLPEDFAR